MESCLGNISRWMATWAMKLLTTSIFTLGLGLLLVCLHQISPWSRTTTSLRISVKKLLVFFVLADISSRSCRTVYMSIIIHTLSFSHTQRFDLLVGASKLQVLIRSRSRDTTGLFFRLFARPARSGNPRILVLPIKYFEVYKKLVREFEPRRDGILKLFFF